MELKRLLTQLKGDRTIYDIAAAYALAKDGTVPARKDRYGAAIEQMLQHPERSQWENVVRLFGVLGVDILQATEIAARQKLSEES